MNKSILTYALVVTALLFADIGWRVSKRRNSAVAPKNNAEFLVVPVNSNDMKAVGLVNARTHEMVRTEWFIHNDTKADVVTYFFENRNVLELHVLDNGSVSRVVHFYDSAGELKSTWIDPTGKGQFSERISQESGLSRDELWFDDKWSPMEKRNDIRGVIVGSNWVAVRFKDGAWRKDSQ
jgi:hypothetical protein